MIKFNKNLEGSPVSGIKQLEHWKSTFSDSQIEKMLAVLKYFRVETYSDELLPLINFSDWLQ